MPLANQAQVEVQRLRD
ncbi:hypothetical protein F383_24993 [Gossypium arboreum]|uniref:Uncharacterized protein n=1 Tax=Gossypium arboreum TaxID=29729 RepID=A0A0B0P703_GOSAR|nr:hypothetical protein F383_24993 [Gossypium arboreum]